MELKRLWDLVWSAPKPTKAPAPTGNARPIGASQPIVRRETTPQPAPVGSVRTVEAPQRVVARREPTPAPAPALPVSSPPCGVGLGKVARPSTPAPASAPVGTGRTVEIPQPTSVRREPTPASAQHRQVPRMPRPPAEEQARQFLAWLKVRFGGERLFAWYMEWSFTRASAPKKDGGEDRGIS
jgi:hypothetical protein